jgi:outer membrane cobalamin receptor
MRTTRLGRLASACRLPFLFVALLIVPTVLRAADTVDGVVVDQSSRPLPRAFVRLVDAAGSEVSSTFTDDAGRFTFAAAPVDCHVHASLDGFGPGDAACTAGPKTIRLMLPVAPIQERIVVTPTKTAAPADQTGVSVTAFTAADIERRDVPLVADLLRSTPGAMVVRSGGVGAQTSLFVRGGESSYNKVLLDGIPLNEPGGTFNFSNLTTGNIERIEVVRGAQSALFGSDAMSSVVQLFTHRAGDRDGRPHADVSIEGGTYDSVRGSALASGATRRFDYTAGVSQLSTDNRAPNNRFDNTTLSGTAGIVLTPTATLRFVARGELERVGTPGQTGFQRPDLDAFFERHDGVGGVSFDQQVSPRFRQRAAYSLAVSNQQSTNLTEDPPYTPQFGDRTAPFEFSDFTFDSRTKLRRHHASYQADVRLSSDAAAAGDHRLTLLADWDGERANLIDNLAAATVPASRNNAGVAVQHQALWRRTFVTVGVRLEHNDSFGGAAVPRASVAYVARASTGMIGDTRVRASAGLGIKEPTILQSFSPSPFFRGNPDLQPERSRTLEAGIEQRVARDHGRIDVAWFDNRYRDIISTRTTDPATFAAQYFNIGLSRARGLEATGDAVLGYGLRARAGYTFIDSAIVDSTSPFDVVFAPGQWLFRRPRHSGYAGLSWSRGQLTADLTGVFIGRFVDSDFASLEPPMTQNPGYNTWDARVSWKLTARFGVTAAADNLGNADYMEPLGYPALKRAVRVGFRAVF